MTFQYIIHHLDKPHSWFIVLTNPHTELNTKKKLEQQGFITYVPLVSVRRCWEGCIKEIHIPAIARCVFVYATDENVLRMQKEYTIQESSSRCSLISRPINISQCTDTDNYPKQNTLYKRFDTYCFQDITGKGSSYKEQCYCQCLTGNTVDSRTD